jgi:WPP domain
MADADELWCLSEDERAAIVTRAAAGISSMSFFYEKTVDDNIAQATAKSIERRAYTRALVESRTTTGVRPKCVFPRSGAAMGARCTAVLQASRSGVIEAPALAGPRWRRHIFVF